VVDYRGTSLIRTLGIGLRQVPRRVRFLMSEVPLYDTSREEAADSGREKNALITDRDLNGLNMVPSTQAVYRITSLIRNRPPLKTSIGP